MGADGDVEEIGAMLDDLQEAIEEEDVEGVTDRSEAGDGETSRTVLDEALRRVKSGDPPTDRYAPALDNLHAAQQAWVRRWNDDGFQDRRGLILALHQLQVWTLGRIPAAWFHEVATNDVLLSVCIVSDRRRLYRKDPVDLEAAEAERRILAAKYVRPAVRVAYRNLRSSANQYLDDEGGVDDPEEQPFPALRPALLEWYVKQARRLVELLNGFSSMDAIDDWLAGLDEATLGALDQVEPDFDWKVHQREVHKQVLLEDVQKYRRERERWAAAYLLPAFNRAIERLAHEADEHLAPTNRRRIEPRRKQL